MSTCMRRMGRPGRPAAGMALLAVALFVLAGCQTTGALSTAASMLVEVDVYKGPLGSSKTVQLGELAAIFDQAAYKLDLFVRDADQVAGCSNGNAPDWGRGPAEVADRQHLCDARVRAYDIRRTLSAFPVPPDASTGEPRREQLKALSKEAAAVLQYQEQRAGTSAPASLAGSASAARARAASANINMTVIDAVRIATQLKVEAFYWSELQIGRMIADPRVRSTLVGYVNLVSELSNQISARTVGIDKQLDLNVAGNALALSDHLKDAGPTDFLHLYDWYQAAIDDPSNGGSIALSAPDRVRLAKRLFSDHYWTRINQVHASGQGDVRMALIKDDIGNWNLKSFDNDAEALLAAYRNLTLAGIDAGIKVARAVGSGGGGAGVDLVSQFARGRLGSSQASMLDAQRIDAMRADVAARLEKIRTNAADEDAPLKAAEDDAARTRDARTNDRRSAEAALAKADAAGLPAAQQRLAVARDQESVAAGLLDTAQAQRREKMAVAFENARREIEVHRRVIDSLKQFQVTSPSTPTSTRALANAMQP